MRPAANAAVFFRPYRGLKATAKGVRPLRGGFLPFHTVASVPRLMRGRLADAAVLYRGPEGHG